MDSEYAFDEEEIGRRKYPPLMAAIAKELLNVMGFAHALDHRHVTRPLEELRPALRDTIYFKDYSQNVKMFQRRARGQRDALADQGSATMALNHVFGALGLRLKSVEGARKNVEGDQAEGGKRRKLQRTYLGWYLDRDQPRSLPVFGPPGVALMAQLLKLRVESSPGLKGRISSELREYLDGAAFRWPELVEVPACMITPP